MKTFERSDRVSEKIQRTLAMVLKKEISDPRLENVVITDVKMARDLKSAKVYFAVYGNAYSSIDKAEAGFKSALGYIKRILAEDLGLRYMPEISFFYDKTIDNAQKIENIIKSLKEKELSAA